MKATEAKFLDFLKQSPQFTIPIYQRTYSWTEHECRQLWDDIIRAGRDPAIKAHFVGSIMYIEESPYHVTTMSSLLVIDGQQRLTTLTLILEALARKLGDTEPVDGFSAEKIRSYYLLNPLEKDSRRYKLLLTQTDKASLLALVENKPEPAESSVRITENFALFQDLVDGLGADLHHLCLGLAKLMIVDIALTREQDNPQLIFESMNSTGRELSQADLIRNFVLMGLPPEEQTRLYEDYWRRMELAFGQEAYGSQFDSFMRHYLTYRTGELPNIGAVYEAFKAHARSPEVAAKGTEALLAELQAFAGYYCAMALGQEQEPALAAAFRDLRELKVDVAYPFLLEVYADYEQGLLAAHELEHAVRLVESYVFRRSVCAIPTNSLNKTFATFGRGIDKDNYLQSMAARLLLLPSYRRFPSDEEFQRDFSTRDLYNFPRRSYWLRRLENDGRKERVPVDEYTIEHIMPQNPNLSPEWQAALGSNWEAVQDTWLHTLGNLTLTGYNSEYSDRFFTEKRDMPGGFKESPLRLNQGLSAVDTWNETTIKARADRLARLGLAVWAAPKASPDLLERYRQRRERSTVYTLADHPAIDKGGPMQGLFERLRKEVLALDPTVTEDILKLYVAYKAETNFVDVVPQKRRLILTLNMRFHELHDPEGLARDVSGQRRWGNGDVDLYLERTEQLPYFMGLIRQAFEKQMGDLNGTS